MTLTVPPREARAFRVPGGHGFRIVGVEGPQVGDLNLWNATDLGERHNLAAERPADVAALRAQLTAWLERVGAQLPRPYGEIPAGELPGTKRR